MNYYPHHIGDYTSMTAHLSWTEDLAYRRLLDIYYRREKPIPAGIPEVCRLVRATEKHECDAVELVLREYFELRPTGWHKDRCDDEIARMQKAAEAARTNGKKGGRPKKIDAESDNQMGTQVVSVENPGLTQVKAPNTNTNTKHIDSRFADFWDVFPNSERKTRKAECMKKWKLHRLDEHADTIISHVSSIKETRKWKDGFGVAPLTYINGRLWEDEIFMNSSNLNGHQKDWV